jgi:hypothetical protein
MLWFFRHSQRRDIPGVAVAFSGSDDEANEAFDRIGAAFELLRKYGTRTLTDLRRNTDGIFVWATAGARGEWHREARLVVLEETHVLEPSTSCQDIASTLVHESTHARLDRLGFQYTPELRERIERACFRRQLAFARRLPDAGNLILEVQDQLARPRDYLTREAFRARIVGKLIELGVPKWIAYAIEYVSRPPPSNQSLELDLCTRSQGSRAAASQPSRSASKE